ncbi:hypothetical protein DITRI_Ditri01bG0200800 [Diplodiscus trichospermus]
MIENTLSGPYEPEMWVTIDGTSVIRIMNLHWRFRGNDIVTVRTSINGDDHCNIYDSPRESQSIPRFCYVLYAWKTE